MQHLKQSTSINILLGPFVDETDGFTPETALSLTQSDILLSKNAGSSGQKNDTGSGTHDQNGWYIVALNATDTGTAGRLRVMCYESGALPVWQDYMVLPANVYDSLYSTDKLQVDIVQVGGNSATSTTDFKADVSALASQSSVDTVDANVDSILADTGSDGVALSTAQVNVIRDAVMDAVAESEGSYSVQQILSIVLSYVGGRTTNSGLTFKTPNNNATRITATADANANRTAITLNPSS